ncbi:alpha/beta hydrolase [Roseateles albus]|uniref:Dienelactone hydrolase family protein n=1 Tax=Roseateles albus TaxID=2987525 RepID=A0ABT5KF76_9BURK|nr:dienelactone hydrolase family protein [Roseateles albus]MDC8772586.1 dienelactone hydrolase family protein [Roseateles albus]
MTLQTIELCPAVQAPAKASASMIVLHGLGADGADFIPMCDALDLSAVGPVRFVLPRATERPITLNNGYRMRAWYDLYGMELQRREDEAGLRDSIREVHALIDIERERGVPAHRIVLAGFSQGCAMTLLAGLRYPERLGGLVAMSGYLPLAASTAAERHDANALVPIFMAHGRQDAMVTMARGIHARDTLTALGYKVAWHEYPMEHSMCMEEVTELNHWLLKVWG